MVDECTRDWWFAGCPATSTALSCPNERKRRFWVVTPTLLAIALAIGGCATSTTSPQTRDEQIAARPPAPGPQLGVTQPGEPVESKSLSGPFRERTKYAAINVTPFSEFSDEWTADLSKSTGGTFTGLYTRLLISCISTCSATEGSPPSDNGYGYVTRSWLTRYLFGEEYAVNLTLKVSAGLFNATVPIVTLDHKSNSDVGEQWSRSIFHTLGDYPLFLVGSGSDTPEITFELKGSLNYSSSIAATAVDATVALAKDIAPQANFVSTLSAPAIANQAQAIDTAIGKLLGQGIDEQNGNNDPIRYWRVDQGMTITMYIPKNEESFDADDNKLNIGSWRVTFEEPRPSIFADWRICEPSAYGGWRPIAFGVNVNLRCASDLGSALVAVYQSLNASDVLNTPLSNFAKPGTTAASLNSVSAYLSQQSWYKTALGKLGTGATDGSGAASVAAGFCTNIANAISAAGLNGYDQDIAVWAVRNASTDLGKVGKSAIKADTTCQGYTRAIDRHPAPA